MNSKSRTSNTPVTEPTAAARYEQPWVTDRAWIVGVIGALLILFLGYFFGNIQAHKEGLDFLDKSLREEKIIVMLMAIGITAAVMYLVEAIRVWRFQKEAFIRVHPEITKGRTVQFLAECLKNYLWLLLLFYVCRLAYFSLNEYGYKPGSSYYAPWFYTLEVLWQIFIYGGLPYIAITRAFKHNPEADRKDLATLTEKSVCWIISRVPLLSGLRPVFDINDKRSARGLAVKFFFAPVMTVFFYDNFSHLQGNFDYIFNNALSSVLNGTYDTTLLSKDLGNVFSTMIFSVDVGLAWCGYIISSRWVDNQTISAEPTMFGWVVCLMSYPPFRVMGGWFLTGPGEHLYLQLPFEGLTVFFGTLMMLTFFLYMLPTIWFGLRFSNLTHRGIVRRGPFALVRHPAYAAKNVAWWCVGLPVAIYVGFTSSAVQGLIYIGGLIFLSGIYYARAITEERHLSFDPDYVEYCRRVPYRFIPGLI